MTPNHNGAEHRIFFPGQLCVSPLNVRRNTEDAEATAAFERSIPEVGLIEPLIVHPLTAAQAQAIGQPAALAAVLAGGRRLRAIHRCVAAGTLPADWPVDTMLRTIDMDAAIGLITKLSLAENMRRDLRGYEVHAGIVQAMECGPDGGGASEEEMADALGQSVAWVRQVRRLGHLDPEIRAAYAAGAIDIDLAKAFAAVADPELQRAAWTHFGGAQGLRFIDPRAIRAWLKVGDGELARLLGFVGLAAYRAAGGRFELDLFHDAPPGEESQRGRVADEGLLRALAEARLDELREDLRAELGRADLRFLAAPPADGSLWFEPRAVELIPADDGGLFERLILPEGVAAHLAPGLGGRADVTYWWDSRTARRAVERGHGAPSSKPAQPEPVEGRAGPSEPAFLARGDEHHAASARAAVKAEHGLTADGFHVVRSLRRELLRAVLVIAASETDPGSLARATLGRDYLIWAQLRQEFGSDRSATTGARGLASAWTSVEDSGAADLIAPHLRESRAHEVWREALAWLRAEPFMLQPDPAASLATWLALADEAKTLAAAVLAGSALLRSAAADGWGIAAHDTLAAFAGIEAGTIRALWSPTPGFMGLLPKFKRLELAAPFIAPAVLAAWAKKDDRTISGATAAAFDPASHSDPAVAGAAGRWVHPLLGFETGDIKHPGSAQAEPVEAAAFLELPALRQPQPAPANAEPEPVG